MTKENYVYILIFIAIIVAVFFVLTNFGPKNIESIDYHGLSFVKDTSFGNITFWHLSYPIMDNGKKYIYNLYIRTRPDQNNIPVDGNIDINLGEKKLTYISIGKGLEGCTYNLVSIGHLSSFLSDNRVTIKGATQDKQQAEENNQTYVTCESEPNTKVIELQGGEETKITQEGNCYRITASNCEILPAVEKFELEAILTQKEKV